MRIATASILYGITSPEEYHRWLLSQGSVKLRMRQMGVRAGQVGTPDAPDTKATPATAYVNHGRWVADCPTAYCAGAVVLYRDTFLCGNCLNAECGYRYRLVTWPMDKGGIEEALSERFLPETANWQPGETTDRLRSENAAYMGGGR